MFIYVTVCKGVFYNLPVNKILKQSSAHNPLDTKHENIYWIIDEYMNVCFKDLKAA